MTRGDVRQRVLSAGYELFFCNGFNATGVKEIVEKAGVPKGSFYAYFDSKDALACAVVDQYLAYVGSHADALLNGGGSPAGRIRKHFRSLRDDFLASDFTKGCLLGRLSSEVADQSPTIREHVRIAFLQWRDCLRQVIEESAVAGELAEGVHPESAAEFLLSAWEGSLVRAKADRNPVALRAFEEVVFKIMLPSKLAIASKSFAKDKKPTRPHQK